MESRKDDRQLLLAIGGVILTGAAGIALIAGLRSTDDNTTPTPAAVRVDPRPSPPNSRAIPAHGTTAEPTAVVASFPPTGGPSTVESVPSSESSFEAPPEPTVPTFEIDPTADFLAEGQRAYARREFDRAVAYLDAAVEARPSTSWPRYMLGLAHWKTGDLDSAAENLRVAGDMNGRTLRPWINLARVENERGEFGAALEACERALAVDPDDPVAVYQRARSLRHLGRVEEAIDECRRSLSYDAEYGDALNLLGLMLIEAGRFGEAVDPLQRAALHAGGSVYVHNNLGVALERSGDLAGAALAFRRGVELEGGDGKAAISLARVESLLPAGELAPIAVAEGVESEPVETTPVDGESVVEVSTDGDVTVVTAGPLEVEDASTDSESDSGTVSKSNAKPETKADSGTVSKTDSTTEGESGSGE